MLLLVAAILATGPVSMMSETQLDEKITAAYSQPWLQRIDDLSKMFVGTTYGELPLGDGSGPEGWPRWRVDKVDCQTFVETVLAMANAHNLKEAKSILDDIRYAQPPPSFENRNHFTEAQWLPANTQKGYLKDEVPLIDGRAPTETLTLRKAQWSQLPTLQRLVPANVPDGKFMVRYLPVTDLRAKAKSIQPGSIIFVVREGNPKYVVRISHMGFVIKGANGWVVRHASTGTEHAVIDEPLGAYIQRMESYKKWPVIGFSLAVPLDASLRVSQIATASR
jgi:hypothetical protein